MKDVQENAEKLNSLRPLTPNRRQENYHFPSLDKEESSSLDKEGSSSLDKEGSSQSGNKEFRTAKPSPSLNEKKTSIDSAALQVASPGLNEEETSIDSAELEDDDPNWGTFIGSEELDDDSAAFLGPEFTGPEPIPERIDFTIGHDSFKVSKSPSYRSLVGGDYSEYASLSSSIKAPSPNALKVVNTAELALFHQRDFVIPERKRAIEIVKALLEGRSSFKGVSTT
jgi:hypothetical protein